MPHRSRCRPAVVLALTWIAAASLTRPVIAAVTAAIVGDQAPATLDRLVVRLASVALAAAVLMLLLSIGLVALDALVGHRVPVVRTLSDGSPVWSRRVALALCGLGIATPIVSAPAWAGGDDTSRCSSVCPARSVPSTDSGDRIALGGLPMPELPSTPTAASALQGPNRTQGRPTQDLASEERPTRHLRVTVRVGDCLWRLAERELGADASDAEVAVRVDQWYTRNRARIGPEPDLIFPGTQLEQPEVTP